ncbi:MAG: hypothetical protein HY012_06365 [Acidobacteria bacterium]|nr:hypothetical protein [Acidobacteriota bacterium]
MVELTALWMPILLSAVVVFVASSVIHMALPYHKSDYKKLPNEEKVLEALRALGVTPGTYHFPHCESHKDMKTPEHIEKLNKGPIGLMTVMPSGPPNMGKYLTTWFLYCVAISFFVAYLTGRTLGPGTQYLTVFRVAGTVGFLSYGIAHAHASIWEGRAWSTTLKFFFDGLVYGCLTAGMFGWLWPKM